MSVGPVRLLIVEDEADIRQGLAAYFGPRGYAVETAASGEAALALLDASARPHIDLVLLDVALPGIDGFAVLRGLRERGVGAPVICLTARGQEVDRVVGLELGADDYVVKPFFFRELEARVKAVLRRAGERGAARGAAPAPAAPAAPTAAPAPAGFAFGDVRVDLRARCAYKRGRLVELAPKELELLQAFWTRPREALSRAELLDRVWGLDRFPTTRTVDTHVARLRKKLEDDPARPAFFLSVPRVGYRFEPGAGA